MTTTRFARSARSAGYLGTLACIATLALSPTLLWAQNPSAPVPPTKQPKLPTTKPVDPTPATPSRGKSREGKPETSASEASAASETADATAASQQFAMTAAEGGWLEVELGRLAVQKGASPDVKQFGQRMIDDHSQINDELSTIATAKKIALPDDADAKATHKALFTRLEALSGAAFDRAYVADMVKDHVQDVSLFDREASQGKDRELQSFARKTLPIMRDHLTLARDLERKLAAKGTQ